MKYDLLDVLAMSLALAVAFAVWAGVALGLTFVLFTLQETLQ